MFNNENTYVTIRLPYLQQDDDLACHLYDDQGIICNTPVEAFQQYTNQMKVVVEMLEEISSIIAKYNQKDVHLDTEMNCIGLEGPQELINELIVAELGQIIGWIDGEEPEDDNDPWLNDWDQEDWDDIPTDDFACMKCNHKDCDKK